MSKGELILKRIKDNKVIDSYYYEELTLNLEEKKRIKTEFLDTNEYKLICNCKSNIEMKIDKNFKRIYPKEQGLKHNDGCPRSNTNSIYNKAWKVDEITGETSVRVDFSLNPNKIYEDKPENSLVDTEDNKKIFPKNNFQSDGKVTVSALVKNLNSQAWRRKAFKRYNFSDKFEFWKTVCYGESNLINLNSTAMVNGKKTKNLREMLFEPYKAIDVKNKETRFTYMYLSSFKDLNNGNFELTCMYQKGNAEIAEYRFIVTYKKFYSALEISNLNINTLTSGDFVVAGFVFRNKFNRIEFFEIAIIRCSKYGIFAESKHEADFYSMLSDNNKIFFKPNKPMPGYKNYIPDAVLLEPNTYKEVFIEIFGFNSEEYRIEMNNKINLVENDLKDTHVLIYWDTLNETMPTIDMINLTLNKIKINKL